jgi:hypothetical protein
LLIAQGHTIYFITWYDQIALRVSHYCDYIVIAKISHSQRITFGEESICLLITSGQATHGQKKPTRKRNKQKVKQNTNKQTNLQYQVKCCKRVEPTNTNKTNAAT